MIKGENGYVTVMNANAPTNGQLGKMVWNDSWTGDGNWISCDIADGW